jgi:uncharacterized small protein (DUF1192 family)
MVYLVVAEKEEFFKELDRGTKTEKDALKLIIDYMMALETSIEVLREEIEELQAQVTNDS